MINSNPCIIHTLHGGNKEKTKLVMIHGYGGSSIMFSKMLGYLLEHFDIYCIDLIGMGASSRHQFTYSNIHEVIELFVESIEQWRKTLDLKSFIMLGHSMGGYISCNYAIKYPQYVIKLVLLSPAAISNKIVDNDKKMTSMRMLLHKIENFLHHKKLSPFTILRKFKFIGNFFLHFMIQRKFNFNKKEAKLFSNYYSEILKLPESTEDSVYYIFEPGAIPKYPIENILKDKLKVPVDMYFGDKDWMDWRGCYRFAKNDTVPTRIFMISNSSHHINIDNPEEVSHSIILNSYF